MSLALLIEIEDKKALLGRIEAQLEDKIRDRAEFELARACHEFKNFFEMHHFAVEETLEEGNRVLLARYGDLKVTLHHHPAQQTAGIYAVLYLAVKLGANEKYRIALQRPDKKRMDVGVAAVGYSLKDLPEVRQEQAIDRLQQQIETTRERLGNFEQEQWVYSIMTDRENPSGCFASMTELLVQLIR